jgi:hypothetical protein
LSSAQSLSASQVPMIPKKITNIHNNASTFRHYGPGEASIGADDTSQ